MENALATIGLLFALFLMVSATAEQIIELFRDFLGRIGIKQLKSGLSIEKATEITSSYIGGNDVAKAKVEALAITAKSYQDTAGQLRGVKEDIDKLRQELRFGGDLDPTDRISEALGEVSAFISNRERVRVQVVRLLTFGVCIMICWGAQFDAFGIISVEFKDEISWLGSVYSEGSTFNCYGMLATALAASAGSTFWHDQLDRVRSVKGVASSLSALRVRT